MKSNGYFYPNLLGSSTHLKFNGWFWKSYPQTQKFHRLPIHFAGMSRETSGVVLDFPHATLGSFFATLGSLFLAPPLFLHPLFFGSKNDISGNGWGRNRQENTTTDQRYPFCGNDISDPRFSWTSSLRTSCTKICSKTFAETRPKQSFGPVQLVQGGPLPGIYIYMGL